MSDCPMNDAIQSDPENGIFVVSMKDNTDRVIAFLNELARIDKYAIAELLVESVPCNSAMAEHPTVQVRGEGDYLYIAPGTYRIGMLGVLNGICSMLDGLSPGMTGAIAAVYEERQFKGFVRMPQESVHDLKEKK